MVVAGDVIVSKIIEKLVEVGFNYATDQCFARRRRMKDELNRRKDALPCCSTLRQLTSARELWVGDCRNMECVGDVTSWLLQNRTSPEEIRLGKYTAKFLQVLVISDSNETLKERCLEDEVADWPNIKHIPYVDVEVLRI